MDRDILKLALPNILTNLTVPLLGMVDMHLMGYLDNASFMGAVALGGVIFNFVYWGFAFLRMSLSGMAAQAFGRQSHSEMALLLYRGLLLAVTAGLVLLVLQRGVIGFSMMILEGSEEVKALAADYFYIRIWAAPAAIALMVINGWFLGMQNAVYPMIISITINIVNIVSSFALVKVFGMKVEGVALGSVISQYVGVILSLILFMKKYRYILAWFKIKDIIKGSELLAFMNVSGDIFLRTLCVIVVFTFFTSKSAGNGDLILAANSALLQFLFLFSYFLDGFAYAAEALIGKFTGSRNSVKLKKAVRHLFLWGGGFALVFTLFFALGGKTILTLFTNQQDVIQIAYQYLPWLIILPLTGFSSFIWDGVYIGSTASRLMRNTMLIATLVFFAIFFTMHSRMGNHALWLAMNSFMLGRGVFQSFLYKRIPLFGR